MRRWLQRFRRRAGLVLCSVGIHDPHETYGVDVAADRITVVTMAACQRRCGKAHELYTTSTSTAAP